MKKLLFASLCLCALTACDIQKTIYVYVLPVNVVEDVDDTDVA